MLSILWTGYDCVPCLKHDEKDIDSADGKKYKYLNE